MPGPQSKLQRADPIEVVARWPRQRPLAALISGPGEADESRWSLLAQPSELIRVSDPGEALEVLARISKETARTKSSAQGPPFSSGWLMCLSYDLGRALEPKAAGSGATDDRGWPALALWRCEGALLHDRRTDRWRQVGSGAWGADAAGELEEILGDYELGLNDAERARWDYQASVARAVELIHAGDIFQANLSHRISGTFEGDVRLLSRDLLTRARPRFGAHLELGGASGHLDRAIVSASPELLLELNASSQRVVTRPIKGTRAGDADPHELEASAKDRAELNMIIDLMRNDLGRVCEIGSVRVVRDREIERHAGSASDAGIQHAVATIEGVLGAGRTAADLIGATFPAGSITGAPKVRAMQVIDELEPVRRGPHFGSIGYLGDDGRMMLNVAIRTAALHLEGGSTVERARGVLDYSVGAGIVADSEPASEWRETLVKGRILTGLRGPAPVLEPQR